MAGGATTTSTAPVRRSSEPSAAPTVPCPRPSKAGALRALGELADVRDDVAEAIRLYRASLELDPKIGVKKRLRALERLQAAPGVRRRIVDHSV